MAYTIFITQSNKAREVRVKRRVKKEIVGVSSDSMLKSLVNGLIAVLHGIACSGLAIGTRTVPCLLPLWAIGIKSSIFINIEINQNSLTISFDLHSLSFHFLSPILSFLSSVHLSFLSGISQLLKESLSFRLLREYWFVITLSSFCLVGGWAWKNQFTLPTFDDLNNTYIR